VGLDSTYSRSPEVVGHRRAEQTILVPVRRGADENAYFTLNEVGTFVWERLDGSRPLSSITEEIVSTFAVEKRRAATDVLEFVDRLEQVGCALEVWSRPSTRL
jgi:hypothetical protein